MHFKKLAVPVKLQPLFLILIFLGLYLLFFYKLWLPGNLPWGSDAAYKHFPAREYLYNTILHEHKFPFYTEKIFGGFEIYADFELGYLNPINVISILIFGPFFSYKVLHLTTYLLGSYGMCLFLKARKVPLIGIITATTTFLYSFFLMNHQIHFNMIMIIPLFPFILVIIDKYLEKKSFRYILLEALLFTYFVLWGHP